jgi:hypothetical protein
LYSSVEEKKYNLIRVDSTIVSDISGKMSEGLENSGRKSIKYTMAFDGILPCLSEIFTEPAYSSEDMALPKSCESRVEIIEFMSIYRHRGNNPQGTGHLLNFSKCPDVSGTLAKI